MRPNVRARRSAICSVVTVGFVFAFISTLRLEGQSAAKNSQPMQPRARPPSKSPDLTLAKTHAGNFTKGQTGATYTLTVTNVGSAATNAAVTVVDSVPPGLAATAASGTGWGGGTNGCAISGQTVTCTR